MLFSGKVYLIGERVFSLSGEFFLIFSFSGGFDYFGQGILVFGSLLLIYMPVGLWRVQLDVLEKFLLDLFLSGASPSHIHPAK